MAFEAVRLARRKVPALGLICFGASRPGRELPFAARYAFLLSAGGRNVCVKIYARDRRLAFAPALKKGFVFLFSRPWPVVVR